ncbi:MAG: Xaa-Pro aminopeptidase, partial [Gammaproteobacteria bacterium]|nr:Xaa-Pro aminopeptidase [Gammaproteobacteria bacterium]
MCLLISSANADELSERILPLRERAAVTDEILQDRLDNLVPQLMRRSEIDAWVIIAREYNEDPVL